MYICWKSRLAINFHLILLRLCFFCLRFFYTYVYNFCSWLMELVLFLVINFFFYKLLLFLLPWLALVEHTITSKERVKADFSICVKCTLLYNNYGDFWKSLNYVVCVYTLNSAFPFQYIFFFKFRFPFRYYYNFLLLNFFREFNFQLTNFVVFFVYLNSKKKKYLILFFLEKQ